MQRKQRRQKKSVKSSRMILFIEVILICLAGIVLLPQTVKAAPLGDAKVIVESYTVTNDAVAPGEEFVLTLKLKNTSDSNAAWNILVSLECNNKEIYPVYGISNQMYIDRIPENSSKDISFRLKADPQVDGESSKITINITSYDFYMNELSKATNNSADIQIPFERKGTLMVSSYTMQDSTNVGVKTRLSATYLNSGMEELTNVSIMVRGEGLEKEYKKTLGNIGAGFSNVAEVYLDFQSVGYKTISLSFQYTDSDGEIHITEPQSFNILVYESQDGGDVQVIDERWGVTSMVQIILLFFIVILGVLALFVYKRRNDR